MNGAEFGPKAPARPLPGRNAVCTCGSGRKGKHCCLARKAELSPSGVRTQRALGKRAFHAPKTATEAAVPFAAQAAFQRGNTLLLKGYCAEALKAYTEALTLWPEYPEVMNSMGRTLAEMGEHQRAIICYAKALRLRPNYVKALNNMGGSLQEVGRTGEAIQSLLLAVRFDPDFADAHVQLSKAYYTCRQYQEAVDASVRALTLRPEALDAVLNLSAALAQQGRLAEAASVLQAAAALRPTEPRFLSNLGQILMEQGHIPEAIAAYARALELQPNYASAYSNLLYTFAFTRAVSAAEELRIARGWEQAIVPEDHRRHAAALRTTPGALPRTARQQRPLRLGVVSAELGSHAVAEFLEPLLT